MKIIFNETSKYKLLSLLRYLGDGFFYPFFALYLAHRGYNETRIGFLLSICPFFAIILNPLYSKFCKNVNVAKKCLGVISILEGIAIILIAYTTSYNLMIAFVILLGIFGCCHYGLLDALTSVYSDSANINYSSIRVYGSFAYILATSIGGIVVQHISFDAAFIIAMILFSLSGINYLLLKKIDIKDKEENLEKIRLKDILSNGEYIFFAFLYCFLLGTITSTDYFFSTYLESRGMQASEYGFIFSYFVTFEVVLLIVFNKCNRKLSSNLLMVIAAISLIIRMIANYLYLPLVLIIILSGLRGVAYACILHVSYQRVINILGENKATLGIMIMTLLYATYVFAFNNINGYVITNYSYQTFYIVNAFIAFLIIIMSLFLFKKPKKSKDEVDV